MKITYLANIRLPTEKAHGAQIMAMCQAFASTGAEVSLVTPKRHNVIKDDPFAYYGAKPVFNLTYLKGGNLSFLKPERLNHFINSLWFPVRAIFSGKLTGDIIYTRDPWTIFILGLAGYPVIYEDHGWPNTKWWYRFCVKKATGIVAVTTGVALEYPKNKLDDMPILVAHDGVATSLLNQEITKTEARQKLNLKSDDKLAVYTGSIGLYDWKGVDVLLETATLLSDYKIVIVGGWESEIVTLKNKFSASNIMFVGQQDKATVRLWQAAADVLVLPNKAGSAHSELYTSPLKLFEYMVAKRPIVASQLPSITEILNNDNAILVEPNNPIALKTGIEKALNSPESLEKAERAFLQVADYTWEKRAVSIVSFLRGLFD